MLNLYIVRPHHAISRCSYEENLKIRQEITEKVSSYLEEPVTLLPQIEIEKGNLLLHLSRVIEKISCADVVYFSYGWKDHREESILHEIAKQYGKIIIEV